MPTYEYQCGACGHKFEKFHSITAEPIKVCPACKKKKVKRLIGTGAGIIFKGSGFYATDYRSENYRNAAKSDSAATPSSTPAAPAAAASTTSTTQTQAKADPTPKTTTKAKAAAAGK